MKYALYLIIILTGMTVADWPPSHAGVTSAWISAPRVLAHANGTVDVTVAVQSAKEELTRNGKKEVVASGVYDLRLFRDGQLVGTSTPRAAAEAYIRDSPAAVAKDLVSKELLNTEENKLWREANDLAKVVKFDDAGKATYTFRYIKLPRDGRPEVEFSAYAFNSDRVKSETVRTVHKLTDTTVRKGKTYLISIGVDASENPDRALRQSAKVAEKTQQILAPRLIAGPANVVGISLVSNYKSETSTELAENNATKAKIRSLFSLLGGNGTQADRQTLAGVANIEKVRAVEPEDELILVYSGHGFRDAMGFFYLLPHDIGRDPRAPDAQSKMISSDELSLWLLDVTAREMIFVIDACNSEASIKSEGFKPGPMGSRGLGQLAYDKRIRILAATQSANAAWQACNLGQSVLSYALLEEGVKMGRADTVEPKGKLTATEWLNYAEGRVPTLHHELLSGKFGTACSQSQGEATSRLQTPKLFDFTRGKKGGIPLLSLP